MPVGYHIQEGALYHHITFFLLLMSFQLSRAAQERCEEAHCQYTLEIGGEPPERLVTADEATVDVLTSYRENGWAPRGMRARKRARFTHGARYVLDYKK